MQKPPAPVQSKRLIFMYHFFLPWLCFQMEVFVVAVLWGTRTCLPEEVHAETTAMLPTPSKGVRESSGRGWARLPGDIGLSGGVGDALRLGYGCRCRRRSPTSQSYSCPAMLGLGEDAKTPAHRGVEGVAVGWDCSAVGCHSEKNHSPRELRNRGKT